jgi:hypothetical protein
VFLGLPIDNAQWEKAGRIVSMEATVLEFLIRDRDKAYSGKEIGNEVMKDPLMKPMTGAAIVACVIMTLDNLFREGKVDVRKLDRIVYYKAV